MLDIIVVCYTKCHKFKFKFKFLTADKGVALVVMDKSQYIDKCVALLNDTKVYKPCKDTTKKLQRHPGIPLKA